MKRLRIKDLKPSAHKSHPLDPSCDGVTIEFTFNIGGTEYSVSNKFEISKLRELVDKNGSNE